MPLLPCFSSRCLRFLVQRWERGRVFALRWATQGCRQRPTLLREGPCRHTAPRGPDGEVPRTDRRALQGLVQLKAHPRGTQGQGKGTVRSKAGETRQGRSPCPLLPRAALPALSTPPAEPAVCGNPGAKDAPKKFPVFAGFAGASGKNTARGV